MVSRQKLMLLDTYALNNAILGRTFNPATRDFEVIAHQLHLLDFPSLYSSYPA